MPDPETTEERRRRIFGETKRPGETPAEFGARIRRELQSLRQPPSRAVTPSAPTQPTKPSRPVPAPLPTFDPGSLEPSLLRSGQTTPAALPSPGFRNLPVDRVLNPVVKHVLPRVEQAMLPFEAFTGGVRGATAFLPGIGNEEDIVSREALKSFFTGRIGPGEVAGELRRSMRRRPFIEQFLSGIVTDPFLLGSAARQGVKVGAKQATRAIEAGRPLALPPVTREASRVLPPETLARVEQGVERIGLKQPPLPTPPPLRGPQRALPPGRPPVVPSQPELVLNFPLSQSALRQLQGIPDDDLVGLMDTLGIRKIQVDPPYTFDLSQEGGVTFQDVIRLNPNVANPRQTLLHELGHVAFSRMSPEQIAEATGIVSRNLREMEVTAPGYARLAREGNPEEAFATLIGVKNPEAVRLANQARGIPRAEVPGAVEPSPVRRAPRPTGGATTWDEIEARGATGRTNILASDDLAGIVQRDGDRMVVVKDVNGGRHHIRASFAAKWTEDDIASGFIREIWLSERPLGASTLDSYTLGGLPQLRDRLTRLQSLPEPPSAGTAPPYGANPALPSPAQAEAAIARIPRADAAIQQSETAIARARLAGESPPPPRRPGEPAALGDGQGPPPRRPDVGLSDDLELPTWENPKQGIMRKWEGARAYEGLLMENWMVQANQKLARIGLRSEDLTEETMRPVFEALHGERLSNTLTPAQRTVFNDINILRRLEESDMIEFLQAASDSPFSVATGVDLEEFARRFMANPDYFPRGWRIDEAAQTGRAQPGRLGGRPSFTRPRNERSFSDMVDQGFSPASWNPYAVMAQRRIAGIEYRESVKFVNRLIQRGLASPADEAPANWRVPNKAGPVFNGRRIPNPENPTQLIATQQIAVPNEVAGFIENVFGVTPDILGAISPAQVEAIRKWTNAVKRFKFVGSFFQHIDFVGRDVGVAFSPTGITRGAPLKLPSLMKRLLEVQWAPGARNSLRRQLISNAPIYDDFDITYPMLIQEGWGVQGDITLIRREFTNFLNDPAITQGLGRKQLAQLVKVQEFFESGLFDGVYRESQRWALENFVIPWVRRTRPNATPRQVAAEAAESVNVMFSTLGNWQTMLKAPGLRELARNAMLSSNESEALLRGAARAISPRAPQAGLFREWYLGLTIGLGALGATINFVATGKPPPKEFWLPLNINDPYGPFGVGYNNRFLSPQIPFVKGRNGQPLYLDLVGQMDTAFRWSTDPVAAAAARTNVLPRAVLNQVAGQTFFGEPLGSPQRRAAQAAVDIAAPIGPTSLIGVAQAVAPGVSSILPEAEPRLGGTGSGIQAGGFNIRGEPTEHLLDRATIEGGFRRADGSLATRYEDLEPFQRDDVQELPVFQEELQARGETGVRRQRETSLLFGRINEIDQARDDQLETLAENVGHVLGGVAVDKRFVTNRFFEIEREHFLRREERFLDLKRGEFPPSSEISDPNEKALARYFELNDQAIIRGEFISQELTRLRARFEASLPPNQLAYIRRNTNRRDVPDAILNLLPVSTQSRKTASERARDLLRRGQGQRTPRQRSRDFRAADLVP